MRIYKKQDVKKRFWSKVNIVGEDDCWEWQAGSRGLGYGAFKFEKKTIDAHRMVWFLVYGEFPDLLVCHSCDNPPCCNPKHLFLGTYQDNMDDAVRKNRLQTGDLNWSRRLPDKVRRGTKVLLAKLNEEKVLDIRIRLDKGESPSSIARIYNVDAGAIRSIRRKDSWAWVK